MSNGKAHCNTKDEQITELKWIIDQLTVENPILKKPRVYWDRTGAETDYDRPSACRLCSQPVMQVLACAPSGFYYHSQAQGDGEELVTAAEQVLMRYPFYSYRRLAELRRRGYEIGEHVARRLLKILGGSRKSGV